VQSTPLLEPVERVLVLQDQVVGYGQDLPEDLRETPLQVLGDAQFLADGVEEPGRSVEKSCCSSGRNRSWSGRKLLVLLLPSSAVGGNNLAGVFIQSADQCSLRSRLSFFPVPVGYGFVGVGDPGAFVLLEDDACHSPTSSLRIYYYITRCLLQNRKEKKGALNLKGNAGGSVLPLFIVL